MNCPFYGRHMFRSNSLIVDPPFLLLDSKGNQCALVAKALSPCVMETSNEMADWTRCPRMREVRMEPPE